MDQPAYKNGHRKAAYVEEEIVKKENYNFVWSTIGYIIAILDFTQIFHFIYECMLMYNDHRFFHL